MKKTYDIEIDCAACAIKCEDAIKKVNGVKDCQINFITQKMIIDAEDIEKIIKECIKCAKKIEPGFEIQG